jgi:hypothetical protein
VTQGRELPLNQLSELLRQEVALAGYTEVLTWALCSRAENFDNMRNPEQTPGTAAVAVGNPQTAEFEVGGCEAAGYWRWSGILLDSITTDIQHVGSQHGCSQGVVLDSKQHTFIHALDNGSADPAPGPAEVAVALATSAWQSVKCAAGFVMWLHHAMRISNHSSAERLALKNAHTFEAGWPDMTPPPPPRLTPPPSPLCHPTSPPISTGGVSITTLLPSAPKTARVCRVSTWGPLNMLPLPKLDCPPDPSSTSCPLLLA